MWGREGAAECGFKSFFFPGKSLIPEMYQVYFFASTIHKHRVGELALNAEGSGYKRYCSAWKTEGVLRC